MKDKFIKAHMQAAGVYARLSSAKRLQVGCVIVKDNTIIGIGYNGMPSGWDNDCEDMFIVNEEISPGIFSLDKKQNLKLNQKYFMLRQMLSPK